MSNTVTEDAKEKARQEIAKLVEKYKALSAASKKKYTEADTKTVFIERLFSALGWDVYGGEDVTQEVRASRGRVDYAFRLRGIPKFFLEAKPLKADLDNPEYAKQVINYAWHKDVTWAILTDFESLKVFNAEWKEPIVSRSQFFKLKCDEYLSRFDWLWLLSRPACEQDLLDKRALEDFKKTKKTPVGQQLFSDLVSWRGLLAKHLSIYNKKYSAYLIDEAVQRILDRLIFIRTCEDRGIEPPVLRPHLREWQNGARKNAVQELKHIWSDFNDGYDSRLFLPHLADELECAPTPFEEVISELYATKDGSIQYDFNAIGADVLGGIYEQYLEHLIKKKGKEAEVFPGRGKRKAQGIYYTPKFVVRYIVENTLGPALKGKPLSEARKIRILDPACGSGSFLVEALDYLENHWRQQKWVPQPKGGENAQQTDFFDYMTKIQFLTENIHGVDLDAQAVEIAQLNLLLKVLSQRERLPNLVNRIREGNSLISGSEDELKRYFGNKWREKKHFNWEQQFEDIMAEGGFDVVIGNPPYVQSRNISDDAERHYYWAKYATDTNHSDIFSFFVQKGIALLKEGGFLGLILPATWLRLPSFASMRRILLSSCEIKRVATFERVRVFEDSEIEPLILIAQRVFEPARDSRIVYQRFLEDGIEPEAVGEIPQVVCEQTGTINLIVDTVKNEIMSKLSAMPKELLHLVHIIGGLRTGDDAKYIKSEKTKFADRPLLRGRNVYRYGYEWAGEYIWYRPDLMKSKQCAAPKEARFFEANEKLLLRMIVGGRLIAAYDDQQFYLLQDNMLLPKEPKHSLKYILGILNSKLVQFFLGNVVSNIAVTQSILKQLPIRRIDVDNPREKKMHDDLVAMVDKMLELNKRLAPIRNTPCNEHDELLRQIKRTDDEIDNLVYNLYGLTEEERKIVEGGQKS